MITRAGVVIARNFLSAEILGKIRRKMTVSTEGFQGAITSLQAHRTDVKAGTIVFGRAMGLQILKIKLENKVLPGVEIKADYKFTGTLADHQMLLRDALAIRFTPERIASGHGYANLLRKAGMGKSFIALSFVERWGRKTLYIVHNIETLDQTAELCHKLYPHLRIGKLSGKSDTNGDIVVAMITSVLKKSREWFAEFHYTILDEIQKYCTRLRAEIFMKCMSPVVLGMTATKKLPNGMLAIMPMYIGPAIDGNALVEEKLPVAAIPWKVESVQVVYHGPPEYTRKMLSACETVSHPLTVNMLSEDPGRLQLVASRAMELLKVGHIIYIMVDRRRYAAAIVQMLTGYKISVDAPDAKIQKMIGGTPEDAKRSAKMEAQVCVVTYACGGVGLSYPRYDAVIFAHPRRNGFDQFNNRVFRMDGDIKITRRLEFVQDGSTSIKGQYSGYRAMLRSEYPEATESKIVYENIAASELAIKLCGEIAAQNQARLILKKLKIEN